LAEQRPDLVDSVAVYETPMSWMPSWPRNTAGAAAVGANDPADSAEAFMRGLIGDAIWERLPPSTRAARRAEGPVLVGELLDLRRAAPWTAGNISVPVLALCGENGRPHHREGTKALAAMLPSGRYGEVVGAGHGAPNSHAGELAEILADFVKTRAD
jgi:pimeloyl-ACP methyl ester carboxylesterase